MAKLTQLQGQNKTAGTELTSSNRLERPFIISFRRKLQKGYRFTDLEKMHLKVFQGFLDKVSGMTVQQVDAQYLRPADKQDIKDGENIQHYKITDSFRIHGVYNNERFEVIRIDTNHKVHDK